MLAYRCKPIIPRLSRKECWCCSFAQLFTCQSRETACRYHSLQARCRLSTWILQHTVYLSVESCNALNKVAALWKRIVADSRCITSNIKASSATTPYPAESGRNMKTQIAFGISWEGTHFGICLELAQRLKLKWCRPKVRKGSGRVGYQAEVWRAPAARLTIFKEQSHSRGILMESDLKQDCFNSQISPCRWENCSEDLGKRNLQKNPTKYHANYCLIFFNIVLHLHHLCYPLLTLEFLSFRVDRLSLQSDMEQSEQSAEPGDEANCPNTRTDRTVFFCVFLHTVQHPKSHLPECRCWISWRDYEDKWKK